MGYDILPAATAAHVLLITGHYVHASDAGQNPIMISELIQPKATAHRFAIDEQVF